jgi:hypothetical protein
MSQTIDLAPIKTAREALKTRQAGLIDTIRSRSPQFSAENAATDQSLEGRFLQSDIERGKQLDWLEAALGSTDPKTSLTATTEAEASAREAAGNAQAKQNLTTTSGQQAANAARSGQAGSSADAENRARIAVAYEAAKAQAKAQADELRAAGISGVDQMQQQLVDSIMKENINFQAAQEAALSGQAVDIQAGQMQRELDGSYKNILSNTLGDILSSAGDMGAAKFNNANRRNQLDEQNWFRARAETPAKGGFIDWNENTDIADNAESQYQDEMWGAM